MSHRPSANGRSPTRHRVSVLAAWVLVAGLVALSSSYDVSAFRSLCEEHDYSLTMIPAVDQQQHLFSSMKRLRQQLEPGQEENFDRSKPIYLDFGLSDAADTGHYLSKGFSVVSVDAFSPWIQKAKEKFATEIASNRLLLFNVGLSTKDSAAMPLYYKQEGSVISSFDETKGCQGAVGTSRCHHTDVEVVRCESILHLLNAQAELMKVDIEMLHHTCLRGLYKIADTSLLPRHVCWEEHDKPFGPGRVPRPITDAKLILGMFELGYDRIKIVMQGPKAAKYYNIPKESAGFGQGSGTQTPDEMMHYRSYEDNQDGSFDTKWRSVNDVFSQGIFGEGKDKPRHFFRGATYYDICMKLTDNAAEIRTARQDPESFPLASFADE